MDSSLSDIIKACGTLLPYDVECMGPSVSHYYYLQKKLTNWYIREILTRVYRDDSRSIKSTETSWSSAQY